jgi:hypothetical protein
VLKLYRFLVVLTSLSRSYNGRSCDDDFSYAKTSFGSAASGNPPYQSPTRGSKQEIKCPTLAKENFKTSIVLKMLYDRKYALSLRHRSTNVMSHPIPPFDPPYLICKLPKHRTLEVLQLLHFNLPRPAFTPFQCYHALVFVFLKSTDLSMHGLIIMFLPIATNIARRPLDVSRRLFASLLSGLQCVRGWVTFSIVESWFVVNRVTT